MADEFLKEINHPGQYNYIQNTAEEEKAKGKKISSQISKVRNLIPDSPNLLSLIL